VLEARLVFCGTSESEYESESMVQILKRREMDEESQDRLHNV
jgi:hypothetical protein